MLIRLHRAVVIFGRTFISCGCKDQQTSGDLSRLPASSKTGKDKYPEWAAVATSRVIANNVFS